MAKETDRTILQRLLETGEDRFNRLVEELLSNPRFADAVGKTVQTAMDAKGRVDRNMQTVLNLLNLPSKSDYKKLATKIEALQGSLVNLNIKLDRVLARQQTEPRIERAKPKRPRPATPGNTSTEV